MGEIRKCAQSYLIVVNLINRTNYEQAEIELKLFTSRWIYSGKPL